MGWGERGVNVAASVLSCCCARCACWVGTLGLITATRLATARLATAAVANMSDEMRVKRQKGATKDSKGAKGSEWKWERGQPAFPWGHQRW